MTQLILSLSAVLLFGLTGAQAMGQEKPTPSPKPATTSPAAETEKPKGEVDRLIEEAKSRDERVLTACLKDCEGSTGMEGLEIGRAIELPKPAYPALARQAHVSGEVVVRVVIDVDGTVIGAEAVSGHPLLMAASVKAAREARFAPTTYLGELVKVTGVIQYNFVAQ